MTELPLVIVQRPARRPVHRPADQDRAGRPACRRSTAATASARCPSSPRARPADCFEIAFEACRIAIDYMAPVILLSDGYHRQRREPWLLARRERACRPSTPNIAHRSEPASMPYKRDPRRWRAPGPSPARPASSTASAAWRSRTSPATSATTPQPREHGAHPRREGRSASPATFRDDGACWRCRRRRAGDRLGRHLRRDHAGGRSRRAQQGHRVGHVHLRYLNPACRTTSRRGHEALQARCWCPS